jgi:arylformamidase
VNHPADDYRAELDFEITFANGGSLRGREFRIDIAHPGMTEEELAEALVRDLGVVTAQSVDIHSRQVMRARHLRPEPATAAEVPAGQLAPARPPAPAAYAPAGRQAPAAYVPPADDQPTTPGLTPPELASPELTPLEPLPEPAAWEDRPAQEHLPAQGVRPAQEDLPPQGEPAARGEPVQAEPLAQGEQPAVDAGPGRADVPAQGGTPDREDLPGDGPSVEDLSGPQDPPGPAGRAADRAGPGLAADEAGPDRAGDKAGPGLAGDEAGPGLTGDAARPAGQELTGDAARPAGQELTGDEARPPAADLPGDADLAVAADGGDSPAEEPAGRRVLRRADLSHVIEDGMVTYPGLPVPQIRPDSVRAIIRTAFEPEVGFQIGEVTLCGNTGTYLDSPFHRYPGADDLSELSLDKLAELDGVLVEVPEGTRAVDRSLLLPYDCRGKAVLIHTGWDRHWGTNEYFRNHPFLTADAATYLAGTGAVLVGIDSLNIDDTGDTERPVHSQLLAAGIPICEHLTNLGALPAEGFRFSAVPPKLRPFGTFPVRAYGTW